MRLRRWNDLRGPYKAEIFSRDYEFRSVAVIREPSLQEDYLTLEGTSVTAPAILAKKGDYAVITELTGAPVYQGIVSDLSAENGAVKLKLSPLLSLFDVTVSYDRTALQTGALEDFLAGVIRDTYQQNPDSLQNIPGLTVAVTSRTTGTALNIKSNVHELWDLASKALTLYGIVIRASLEVQEKQLTVTIGKNDRRLVLESELSNCLGKNFVLTDDYGALNKATYLNKDDESQQVTYYLHTDGSVDTEDRDRVEPVFFSTEYIEGAEDFAAEAQRRAGEALTPQVYEQLIELRYRQDDPMVTPAALEIGTQADILYGGKAYRSILTGYELDSGTITLVFGAVRMELTKKLILERRKKNADT